MEELHNTLNYGFKKTSILDLCMMCFFYYSNWSKQNNNKKVNNQQFIFSKSLGLFATSQKMPK